MAGQVSEADLICAQVNGALLSLGDCHTSQGDSEFDGTAIETSITARLRLTLHKQGSMPKVRHPRLQPLRICCASDLWTPESCARMHVGVSVRAMPCYIIPAWCAGTTENAGRR